MVHEEDTRGVWCARARVCTAFLDLARELGARHPCERMCVCVRVCARARVRVYVNPCVGDDALQTRVKSRGGREFLCASRPVLPLRLLHPQRSNPPRPARVTLPPWFPSHHPVLPLAPGLQPWGRFESGSRWMRGKGRERCSGNKRGEGGGGEEGEAERERSEREGQKSGGGGQWEEVPEPRAREEPTTSPSWSFCLPRSRSEESAYLLLWQHQHQHRPAAAAAAATTGAAGTSSVGTDSNDGRRPPPLPLCITAPARRAGQRDQGKRGGGRGFAGGTTGTKGEEEGELGR